MKLLNYLVIISLALTGLATVPSSAQASDISYSRVEVQAVSGAKATVAWSTNVPTTGIVKFGTNTSQLIYFLGDSVLRTEHVTELVNLQPQKKYYFVVVARDASGVEATSFSFDFTTTKLTQAEEDELDENNKTPTTTNDRVGIDGVSATVAAVAWASATPTRGTVQFNVLDNTKKYTSTRTALGTNHQVLLKSLKINTTYEYTVTMKDEDGDVVSVRGPFRFTTADSRAQEDTALTVAYLGPASTRDSRLSPTSATVQFSTNHLANGSVAYKATTKGVKSSGSVTLTRYGSQHSATLTNLKPNTDYDITITAKDVFGKTKKLATQKFHTPKLGPVGRLVKAAGANAVYYVYASGKKKPFINEAAFYSYGNRFADVESMTAEELTSIPGVQLLKATNSPAVYLMEGTTRRPIVSEAKFLAAGYRWADIELANPTDVASYPLGTPVN